MGINECNNSQLHKLCSALNFSRSANLLSTSGGLKNNRGVVHSINEKGKARLIFDADLHHFRGILLNSREESVSITGIATTPMAYDPVMDKGMVHLEEPTTSHHQMLMRISVVDGDTGDKFRIENVPVCVKVKQHDVTNIRYNSIEINHPAIKFNTDEILHGNRADVEVQKYLDPPSKLPRSNSRSTLNRHLSTERKNVYIGTMQLKVVASERTEPSTRLLSVCEGCATKIIAQSDDFLV